MTPTKTCRICNFTSSNLDLFPKKKGGKHGRENRCKPCKNEYHRQTGHNKGHNVQSRFGISRTEYITIMEGHTRCECCGKEVEPLCYDHDHETMKFRGRLCHNCNRGLGLLGDTLEALEAATEYLRRHYETD